MMWRRRFFFAILVVLLGCSVAAAQPKVIYQAWRSRHSDEEGRAGSRAVDIKAAIVEHFQEHATIFIATEAAAEGVNLQFCSLVVNYDLPWNPQRIASSASDAATAMGRNMTWWS